MLSSFPCLCVSFIRCEIENRNKRLYYFPLVHAWLSAIKKGHRCGCMRANDMLAGSCGERSIVVHKFNNARAPRLKGIASTDVPNSLSDSFDVLEARAGHLWILECSYWRVTSIRCDHRVGTDIRPLKWETITHYAPGNRNVRVIIEYIYPLQSRGVCKLPR